MNAIFKWNCTLKLFIPLKKAYYSCSSLVGKLDFPDFLSKSFITLTTVLLFPFPHNSLSLSLCLPLPSLSHSMKRTLLGWPPVDRATTTLTSVKHPRGASSPFLSKIETKPKKFGTSKTGFWNKMEPPKVSQNFEKTFFNFRNWKFFGLSGLLKFHFYDGLS